MMLARKIILVRALSGKLNRHKFSNEYIKFFNIRHKIFRMAGVFCFDIGNCFGGLFFLEMGFVQVR